MKMMAKDFVFDPKEVRHRLGLNQQEFWNRIGVTQSGGSRYERGRRMPKPVRDLLYLVHIERIDPEHINREDVNILDYLKSSKPEIYQELLGEVRATREVNAVADAPAAAPAGEGQSDAVEAAAGSAAADADSDADLQDDLFSDRAPAARWAEYCAATSDTAGLLLANRRR